MDLQLGDKVIHKLTRQCGVVEALEDYGTTKGQMISVRLTSGIVMRGIPRSEFGLHNYHTLVTTPENIMPAVDDGEKLSGAISTESILDQIE